MNPHRIDFASLSLFSLIARTGSISKGAALAHLAVGAASKRISDLELAVGTPLLERHSRGVTLTVAGQALYRHAQRILADVDVLAAEMSDFTAGIVGVVRLWANTSAVTQFLPHQLAAFTKANPGIRIELEEKNSNEIVLAVLDGRADVGIFADRTPALGLQCLDYCKDHLSLVVPKGHPLAGRRSVHLAEVLDYDFVSLSEGTSLADRLQTETEALGRRLKLRIRVRSFDAMCQMVAADMGIAVLPSDAVRALARSLNLRQIALADDWAQRRLLIGLRDVNAVPRHVRTLIEHLRTTQNA
ncbi:LysR substrate-binding domain-containing protein [Pandoraea sp. ISTKB]|uniref:LysR substrate-binding domain-containing protein n=1 Tax=Pandoraea sp. ISTKB TaxID=1586708 RepID=UPI0008472D2A|nr:LysR substrate-binding domain-containing protein [Pandoraea sp. ISTKB]ODP32906.1 GntR family transcriptional regulator [Pandoraea sp. ISTKB]